MDVSRLGSEGNFSNSQGTAAGNLYGISSQIWQTVAQEHPNLVQTLLTMPEAAVNLYKSMNMKDKELFARKIHGKTQYLWFTINNRKAFIEGTVMGQSVFPFIKKKIEEDQQSGKISSQEAGKLLKAVSVSQSLTPKQREALVTLDETETGISPS